MGQCLWDGEIQSHQTFCVVDLVKTTNKGVDHPHSASSREMDMTTMLPGEINAKTVVAWTIIFHCFRHEYTK